MKSLSLFASGLTGVYQLGVIQAYFPSPLFGKVALNCGLVAYNTTTGDFIFADDFPVSYKPGFLLQGRRTKTGERDVFHGKVFGTLIPDVVSSTIGASMPSEPGSDSTCFRVINDPNTSKYREYLIGGSGYTTVNYKVFHHAHSQWHCGTSVTEGTFMTTNDGKQRTFNWTMRNALYELKCTIVVTGNILHAKKGALDTRPHYGQGYRYLQIETLASHTIVRADSLGSTQLSFVPFCAPTDLSSLTTAMVMASIGTAGKPSFNEDLLDLHQVSSGNASWLSCYNAVNSMKFIEMQWLEFFRDAYHWKELIPGIRRLSDLRNPKMWGELFLWFSYGIRPTIDDVLLITNKAAAMGDKPLSEQIKKFSAPHSQYGTAYEKTKTFLDDIIEIKCNARIDLHTRIQPETVLGQLILFMQSAGMGVDARNVWELISYSFVVDWFVNTADLMKFIDLNSAELHYDITQCITSEKKTALISADRYFTGASGFVGLQTYERVVSSKVPVQPFELRLTDPSSHWLEASALLITRH